jgi:hypothetical protein
MIKIAGFGVFIIGIVVKEIDSVHFHSVSGKHFDDPKESSGILQ